MSWNDVTSPRASVAERRRRRRRDGVENAEQRVGIAALVAGDQLGIVEVVAGVHAHALRNAPAHGDFLVLVEQRNLHAVDLVGVVGDDIDRDIHRLVVVARSPSSRPAPDRTCRRASG